MSDCKAPCRKYKEKIDKLTSQINMLQSVLETMATRGEEFEARRKLKMDNFSSFLKNLVHPPSLQSDTIQESDQDRPQDGCGCEYT